MNGVFENTFSDPSARALHGILCLLSGMKEDLLQMKDAMVEIRDLYSSSMQSAQAVQAKAQEILQAHQNRIDQYNAGAGGSSQPAVDLYPLKDAPTGTTVADLPSGQRLFTLPNGVILRTEEDHSITAALSDGEIKSVVPGPANELHVAAGLVLQVENGFLKRTEEKQGIQGLPNGVEPVAIGEKRISIPLPSGIRVDILRDQERMSVITPGGVILTGGVGTASVNGDTLQKHLLSDGLGFLLEASGIGGIIYNSKKVELSLPDGTDLEFFLGEVTGGTSGSGSDPLCQGLVCEVRKS